MACWQGLFDKCFQRCSVRAEQAVIQRDMNKALQLIDARIAECCAKETKKEQNLMQAQHALRCMAANLANDPYPEVLMHRLKAQVMEKNAAQKELDRATSMVQQLKTQRRILQESELSSEVLFTLQRVMNKMQPHVKRTSALTDLVVDMALENRDEVADVTRSLTDDLEDAFDYSDDAELAQHINMMPEVPLGFDAKLDEQVLLEEETSNETELLMKAIRLNQKNRLAVLECE